MNKLLKISLTAFYWIMTIYCLNAQGIPTKQWDKTFGGINNEEITSVKQTNDGDYILGGSSDSGVGFDKSQSSRGGKDFWIMKVDANGVKQWDKAFGGNGDDQLTSLQQITDGGFILGGSSNSTNTNGDKSQPSQGKYDFWIVKVNSNGIKQWDKTFGGSEDEKLESVIQTTDGGYLLGGYSKSAISGDKSQNNWGSEDFWAIKLDTNGNLQWDKTFGGYYADGIYSVIQTTDGSYILGGISFSGIGGNKTTPTNSMGIWNTADYWIVKIDATGTKIWEKNLGGGSTDYLWSIQQTTDGGLILGGTSHSLFSGDKTDSTGGYWILKLDALGNKQWDKTFSSDGGGDIRTVRQTVDGGYLLGGSSWGNLGRDKSEPNKGIQYSYDFWIIKTDASGNKIWDRTIGGNLNDELLSLELTSDGGYILGGYSKSDISADKSQNTIGGSDFWVVKLTSGVLGINELSSEILTSVCPNPNNGRFMLNLNNLKESNVEIDVSDMLGKVLFLKKITATENQLFEEINLPPVKGMYLLKVKNQRKIFIKKIAVE